MIIGIDLGTTNSLAAYFTEDGPKIIPNRLGKNLTPSIVSVDENDQIYVGETARERGLLYPGTTAQVFKRSMGSTKKFDLGHKQFTAEELSSFVLRSLKEDAEAYLKEEVTEAVISVPAYFDDKRRKATKRAGELAGLKVERIIGEPTAAAIAYGLYEKTKNTKFLVFDLGGGTFDVTVLEMFEGVLEVKASSGDNKLGGKDFDERLIQYLTEQFREKHGIDLSEDLYAMARVRDEALRCKIALSTQESYTVQLPVLTVKNDVPYAMDEVVTRAKFEELIQDLVERTHKPIDVVLSDSGIQAEELDKILLVGGSTRVPLVRRDIEAYFGKKPEKSVDPDYAVAQGAAVQAAIISGLIDESSEIVMTDVNPYTLGVRSIHGFDQDYMSVIIPRNKTIPTTKKQRFYTSGDGQTEAVIEVYQGESSSVRYNHHIGEFTLKGIPGRAAGEESIDVSFSYNQNGMLHVTGIVVSTGQEASIEINMLDTKEARVDVSGWKSSELAGEYRSAVRRAEKWVKDHEEDKRAEELLYYLKKAILEEDEEQAEEFEGKLQVYTHER